MSNSTVDEAFAAELAELARLVPQPASTLGYGSDLSCVTDVTEDMAELDPFSVQGIGEAAVRRLTTPRGALLDDPDYGLDVRAFANRATTLAELQELQGRCSLELAKDDRIESASVLVLYDSRARSLSVSIYITPADALGPFTYTFAVGADGTVTVEGLR